MASIGDLRARSTAMFTELAQAHARPDAARTAESPRPFSWFDRADALRATMLSFQLSAAAAASGDAEEGLERALDIADERLASADPELVRQGLALFVTHNVRGRMLAKPRTVTAAPELFSPPRATGSPAALSVGGLAPGLDYWREDALANEHHEHWHQVYPWPGRPPRDFTQWVTDTPQPVLVAILEALAPSGNWAQIVANATVAQLAATFAQVPNVDGVFDLPSDLYRAMFTLNDRQGELFFYMHEQMLARYDAELRSNDLDPVKPFGPDKWAGEIPEGYTPPSTLSGFGKRDPDQTLLPSSVDFLTSLQEDLDEALQPPFALRSAAGGTTPIDRTLLGEAVEATLPQLRDLAPDHYGGLHNSGHVSIAILSDPPGVMISPTVAIRDQVFWRWHKHIDDLNATWQDSRDPVTFGDAPAVVLRPALAEGPAEPWRSPDIILCRTADLPAGTDPTALGEQLFGGEHWSTDFSAAAAGALTTVDTLTTSMATVSFGGQPVDFLTHEPFSYFLRVENPGEVERRVTVRVFLAPQATADQRGAWIEMDKFPLTVPAATRLVAYRPDTESSVVKRPVDLDPSRALGEGSGPEEDTYCDCGWPYTLLLPRGTPDGLPCRLVVLCTDAATDMVPEAGHCGSMSFCGAVDRYPDTRDMGYPFARPFPAAGIDRTLTDLGCAAGRSVTVKHLP